MVKSGADFPAYIRELKQLGITHYETFVADGHTDYYGADNYKTSSDVSHYPLSIAETADKDQFRSDLKAHQNGILICFLGDADFKHL